MAEKKLAVSVFLKGFDSLSGPLKALMGVSEDAKGKIRALSDEARAQKGELADLRDQMKRNNGGTDEMRRREAELAAQLEKTTQRIDLEKAAQKRLTQAREDARKARDAGTKNLAIGAGLAAPLVLAGKAASDFQDGMTDIRQKADLSAEATQKLENRIMLAARAAGQMPEEMRKGVDYLAGAGLDPNQAIAMMTPIARAATAYRAQIEDLSRASFSAVDNLKVPFNQTALAIDAMAKAGKDGNFELNDMAMYFPQLTAAAQGLGQHGVGAVADLAAALQIARKGAGDSASAANNVQNLLAKINSNETVANFKKFGIDLPAAMKKAYAEGKTPLEAISELTKKATGGDLARIPQLFNDMQVQNALRPLIQNMDEYRKIRADAMKAAGTVDSDFQIRSQNASVQARILAGDVQHVAVVLGEQMLPAVNRIAGPIVNLADAVANWSDKHKTASGILTAAVAGVAALNLVVGAGRLAYAGTVGPVMKLYNAYMFLKKSAIVAQVWTAASTFLGGAMTAVRAGMIAGAQGVWTFTAALLANPVTWIVVAIVAAVGLLAFGVYELIKHWDKVGPWLSNLWTNIKTIFVTGVHWAWQAFLNFTPLGWFIQSVSPALDWLRKIDMLGVGKHLIDGLIGGIMAKWTALKSTIKSVADGAANWFKQHLGIHSPSRVFMAFGGNIAEGLRQGIEGGMDGPMRQTRRMAGGVIGAMTLTAPGMAAAAPPRDPPPSPAQNITIHIHAQPGQDAESIARAVRVELERHAEALDAKKRSAFRDDED